MWKEVNNVIMDVTFVSGLRMYIQYSAGTYGEHTDREWTAPYGVVCSQFHIQVFIC